METSVPIVMHGLGLLGMAGVVLMPMRIWSLVAKRRIGGTPLGSGAANVATFIISVSIVWSLYMATRTMPVVFHCLYTSQCTADLAGGLLNLALFGFSVAIVEVLWHASRFILFKVRHAT